MAEPSIRPYCPTDEAALLDVWNRAMWADPVDAPVFRRMVLLDPNVQPGGLLVAELDGRIVGFCLAIRRRVPHFVDGLQADRGWITAFGVTSEARRRGVGNALLGAAERYLAEAGVRRIAISPYVPNYFTPGVDVAAYPAATQFLERRGFAIASRPLSMRAELTGFQVPDVIAATAQRLAADGVTIRPAMPDDIVPVLAFAAATFSWDWWENAAEVFSHCFVDGRRGSGMWVAHHQGTLVGYSMHRLERFGPFGVAPAYRSRGIGRVLLAETLLGMRRQQLHAAWFLWTGDAAARLYSQCGFHEVRRFAVMEKDVG